MATIRTWPLALALALPLVLPAVAEASYKYTTTIRFSGTYTSDEYDAGIVVSHVQSKTTFTVRDARLVITVKNGAIALYPSGHTTARLATTQSGFRVMCDSATQTFTDRISHRPGRGWVTLKRRGSRASLGFGWSGESVDRHYIGVTEGDCSEPAETEQAGGNDDEAGAAAMASRFHVSLKVPLSSLMRGRSVSRKITVHRVESDLLDGVGTKSRLDGSYRIILSRIG
jgi:hypothetical protein